MLFFLPFSMKQPLPKILFLDILTDHPETRAELEKKIYLGKTYADPIQRVFHARTHDLFVVDGTKMVFPDPRDFDGIVVSGSTSNPVRGEKKP